MPNTMLNIARLVIATAGITRHDLTTLRKAHAFVAWLEAKHPDALFTRENEDMLVPAFEEDWIRYMQLAQLFGKAMTTAWDQHMTATFKPASFVDLVTGV